MTIGWLATFVMLAKSTALPFDQCREHVDDARLVLDIEIVEQRAFQQQQVDLIEAGGGASSELRGASDVQEPVPGVQ